MQQNQSQYKIHQQGSYSNGEINLRELFVSLWDGKWIIILFTAVFSIGSVIYAIKQPDIYKADALLAPADSSGSGGLSKMAGQLGGLAALAGVNIGSSDISQANLAAQVMKSRQFIENFISEHELLVPIMAVNGWDLNHNELIVNEEIYNEHTKEWLRNPKGLRGAKPSVQEAYEVFKKDILSVDQDKDSGLYNISVMYYSPYVSRQWVNWLVEDINRVMRDRTIAETTQNLSYLNAQLQKTSVTDMKSTFYTLIEEQTKSLMLAEVQDEFVFKVIDPAVLPEVKNKPKRAFICILGTLIGMMIGITVTFFKFTLRR
ncbi:lipopolysaccharide biosynthesis protein [Vibrio furnissii]|uniref:Lipopolysaccharide biosynthesis protein n=1 Tax=Vibrio furnissii TaxID=29494 RepID=A0A0Q2XQX4_VIBFU|nr:Wzz/FepE/Etk N-terminal domain-containing protein [Vibrio furnissii]KQH83652.1 lipopolysaccharide biosynthesis protein [Vibrio furnissii]